MSFEGFRCSAQQNPDFDREESDVREGMNDRKNDINVARAFQEDSTGTTGHPNRRVSKDC